ncbi:hypothetical protein LIER_32738 [Lithospermum erythrorhizon]|uniref:Uncharacterized protein n=1 Tax=Lithospermum erythrorhizon TaxID=34254 RepID=A0AAV3RY37_LITER
MTWKLYPYRRGLTNFDFMLDEFDDFGIRDVDEFTLRNGCSLRSSVVYVYSVQSSRLTWLKPMATDYDIEEFKKVSLKEKFMNIYIDNSPKNEFLRLYSNELPLRKLSFEGSVHREMDTFDDELDKEIREENIEQQRKEVEEIENIVRENEMDMRSVESGSSIPKKNFVETYARHGEEFKLRKATGYVESSSDFEMIIIWIAKGNHIGYTDWCVKNINKTHNGCPEKKIHFCNITFLAKALEGKSRVMPEMSLTATQLFIDDMFHVKVSNKCARNTKEKALKNINEDHLEQFNLVHTYCKS